MIRNSLMFGSKIIFSMNKFEIFRFQVSCNKKEVCVATRTTWCHLWPPRWCKGTNNSNCIEIVFKLFYRNIMSNSFCLNTMFWTSKLSCSNVKFHCSKTCTRASGVSEIIQIAQQEGWTKIWRTKCFFNLKIVFSDSFRNSIRGLKIWNRYFRFTLNLFFRAKNYLFSWPK